MRPLLLAALTFAASAAPAVAQVIPDEFPDRTEPVTDRVRRQLVERHRAFLSGLYAEGGLAAGPVVGTPALYGSARLEGGYRFQSGDAVAFVTSFRTPLNGGLDVVPGVPGLGGGDAQAMTASLGVQGAVALRRLAPESDLARRADLGLGVGTAVFGSDVVMAIEVVPRVAFDLTPTLSLPVGLRLVQEVGGAARGGPFVGLSVGLRQIWADSARMVLE